MLNEGSEGDFKEAMEAESVKLNETIKAFKDEALALIESIKKTIRYLRSMVYNPGIEEDKRQAILRYLESMIRFLDPVNPESFQNQVERLVWYQNFWTWAAISHRDHSKNDLFYEEKMVDQKIKEEIKNLAVMRLNQMNPTLISQAQQRLASVEELLRMARQEIVNSRHSSGEANSANSTSGAPSQSAGFANKRPSPFAGTFRFLI